MHLVLVQVYLLKRPFAGQFGSFLFKGLIGGVRLSLLHEVLAVGLLEVVVAEWIGPLTDQGRGGKVALG
jgi:hypothetical protein